MTDKQKNPDPIAHASRLLREAAEELRQAHTYPGSEGWENETDAKAAYDEHMAASQALEDWEAAVGAGGVQALSAAPAVRGVPSNFITHRAAWREALETAKANAIGDDVSYWCHELRAFDRSFDRLWELMQASPTPPAKQAAPKAAPVSSDTLYLLRRLLSNQHTLTGPEFRAELEKIVGEAYQQEAQEPTAISEAIERMAADRYKVVPSHESMFHRWAVVAGTGTQQLYLGREVECQNMARKFAGAFLDGAFVAMQQAAPQPAPAPLSERDAFEAWIKKDGGDLSTFGTPPNMHYRNSAVNNAWVAWKARAVLAAQGGK